MYAYLCTVVSNIVPIHLYPCTDIFLVKMAILPYIAPFPKRSLLVYFRLFPQGCFFLPFTIFLLRKGIFCSHHPIFWYGLLFLMMKFFWQIFVCRSDGDYFMEFNNKTILITGLVVASIYALFLNNEQISLAIVSGLLGYLAKDAQVIPQTVSEEVQDYGSDSEVA